MVKLEIFNHAMFSLSQTTIQYHTEVDKLFSMRQTFQAHNFTYTPDRLRKKIGGQNQSARPIQAEL